LEQNPFEGVLAIKVPSASFGLEIIEQKAPKNVEGLSPVGEAARVVAMEVRGVVLFFEHGLPKKNEGPGNGKAVGRLPFTPDTEESTLGLWAGVHSMRQCWADSWSPWSQPLQGA